MRRTGNRMIKVNKKKLINKIIENKENHIIEYDKAVIAYKKEAIKQLEQQMEEVKKGSLKAKLNLITPIDNRENYDKILDMFKWEEDEIVELEQSEFNEYVQDETQFALQAKMSNMSYIG